MTRDELKEKAQELELDFPANIPTDKLQEMVNKAEQQGFKEENDVNSDIEKLKEQLREQVRKELEVEFREELNRKVEQSVGALQKKTEQAQRNKIVTPKEIEAIRREALKLVRINVIPNDPIKIQWQGEIIAAGNDIVGDVKKYVKFNTTEGYYVPYIIYKALDSKQATVFKRVKKRNSWVNEPRLIKAFNITVLPNHTEEELAEMAKRQKAMELQED